MARAPYQVLVIPYRILEEGGIVYAIFRREPISGGYWQAIAGGGEGQETPLDAAKREAAEEAGIPGSAHFLTLDCSCMIPVVNISGFVWGPDVLVIPEYCFGVQCEDAALRLSREHDQYRWVDYELAHTALRFDSNKSALWELDLRLRRNKGLAAKNASAYDSTI